jgi:3-methylcrotonyl-CoA carboxylase beta subunit
MGLGGPNLVKGATGQVVGQEELGGARVHTEISGVAHYRVPDDGRACVKLREQVELPVEAGAARSRGGAAPLRPASGTLRHPPRTTTASPTRCTRSWSASWTGAARRVPADRAREMICGTAFIDGSRWGHRQRPGARAEPRGEAHASGGSSTPKSAEKVAYFIETMNRQRRPLLFVQDVSGFMVGPEAEHSGIIRAGAEFVEAMATATVPKLVLTLNHASGAGYYAMAGQGFDPDFILSLPTGRMGVMEGESAVMALFSGQIDEAEGGGEGPRRGPHHPDGRGPGRVRAAARRPLRRPPAGSWTRSSFPRSSAPRPLPPPPGQPTTTRAPPGPFQTHRRTTGAES